MADDVFGILDTTQGESFRVVSVVAEGGFSVVYRADHGGFRAPVALKCLKVPTELDEAQRAVYLEKFREEAELLFHLSSAIPEVVRPLHVGTLSLTDGRFAPFLALEWLDGHPLDEVLEARRLAGQAPMGPAKAVKMLSGAARALARFHRFTGPNGPTAVIHRDVKPENIFIGVGPEKSVKILDFGIATAMSAAERRATKQGGGKTDEKTNWFTPRYGAPEQWAPEIHGPLGPWTDVWGLAITMVEVLSGAPPIDGEIEEMRKLIFDPERRPTPRARKVVVNDAIEAIFERALAVRPRERTQSIEAFWTALENELRIPSIFARSDARIDPATPLGARRIDPRASIPPEGSVDSGPGSGEAAISERLGGPDSRPSASQPGRSRGSPPAGQAIARIGLVAVSPAVALTPEGPVSQRRPRPQLDSLPDLEPGPPSSRVREQPAEPPGAEEWTSTPPDSRRRAAPPAPISARSAEPLPPDAPPASGRPGAASSQRASRPGRTVEALDARRDPPAPSLDSLEFDLDAAPASHRAPPPPISSHPPLPELESVPPLSPRSSPGAAMVTAALATPPSSRRSAMGGPAPAPPEAEPRRDPRSRSLEAKRDRVRAPSDPPSPRATLRPAFTMLGVGLLLVALDLAARGTGAAELALGPIRLVMVGGLLAIAGVGLFFWRMFGEE